MAYKKITNPDELIVGRLYADVSPSYPNHTILRFEKLKGDDLICFTQIAGSQLYLIGEDGLVEFENDFDNGDCPFYELPQDFELSHVGTTNPTDLPIQ